MADGVCPFNTDVFDRSSRRRGGPGDNLWQQLARHGLIEGPAPAQTVWVSKPGSSVANQHRTR